ncbi:MAG: hypothetical protein A2Y64_02525 [Candidatus Coatesbacteria bacterium RBG_13_66_14]|uniref:DUF4349 domain-containing protein n=1 Tax=Candidatus Coatesbacteria bacterium RBG_13_66_14 TaxID=1817816 RepID=A0A1F5F695_9BACT|nr:MAG: hypothetical protein A2Y64_02525 [Candidatus Coatesbacteria bacterium RBG_13_66_14]
MHRLLATLGVLIAGLVLAQDRAPEESEPSEPSEASYAPGTIYQTFSGRLVVAVDDFEKASAEAKAALPTDRGTLLNIEESRTKDDLDEIFLEYVVRADYADELLASLTALGDVIVEETGLTDVTKRVGELREEVDRRTARVAELEERADRPGMTMDDRIAVQRDLSREKSELERASGTLAKLVTDTRMYPLEVTLVEGHVDRMTEIEEALFTIVLPGLALLVAAFFLGRLVGKRGRGKDA